MKDLAYLNKRFRYKSDGRYDRWTLMKEDSRGLLHGDCEDYALWVAYYRLANQSWWKLYWKVIKGEIKFHYVRTIAGWDPHMVLECKENGFIDNWHRRWVGRSSMERNFKFKQTAFITTIWYKQLIALWRD